jgi:hypothetical protein
MNIFVLDTDPIKCAQYHCDKHVVKMVLESTQLLNNALYINDIAYSPYYRITHLNHPASLWASKSLANYEWLICLAKALSEEYTYRYNKIHKCASIVDQLDNSLSKNKLPKLGLSTFEQCMPEQYRSNDPVKAYRSYMRNEKAYFAVWTKREVPNWWVNGEF